MLQHVTTSLEDTGKAWCAPERHARKWPLIVSHQHVNGITPSTPRASWVRGAGPETAAEFLTMVVEASREPCLRSKSTCQEYLAWPWKTSIHRKLVGRPNGELAS